MRENAWVSKS